MLANRQLFTEVANHIDSASRLSFAKLSQALFFFRLTQSRLSQLSMLDLTLPAYETRDFEPNLLEPIFKLLVEQQAPLKTLFLHLTPSIPGRISYPVPLYMIPRYGYELDPIHDDLYTRSPRFPYVRTHSVEAVDAAPGCRSWIGRLEGVTWLVVRGQPEFGRDVELALLKLYLRMLERAKVEGKKVVLSRDNGSKGHEYYFEAWIAPVVEEERIASGSGNQ